MSSNLCRKRENELSNMLSHYEDDDDSESSTLEDGECSPEEESLQKEQLLRQKLLNKIKSRKRKSSHSDELNEKYPKLMYNESFSCVRSRFDSQNDESNQSEDELNNALEKEASNSHMENISEDISPIEVSPVCIEYESNINDYLSALNDVPNSPASINEEILPSQIYYPAKQGCRSINNYKMLNRIEEGSYGEVFRAKDKSTGRIWAIKKLKLEDSGSNRLGFPITSIREVNTLMQVSDHRNIVKIREIVTNHSSSLGSVYLVMEFVEHDLKSFLKVIQRPLQVPEVKCLMLQFLSAVAHLHDNWIIHRDLKTSNLLLSHSGILKVADFGLAREYGSPLKPYTSLVVTLWYRAPELLMGQKLYSTSIDVWSVGCIMGEMVLNKPMFSGKTEIEQLQILFRDFGGKPTEKTWPGCSQLSGFKDIKGIKIPPHDKITRKTEKKLVNRLSPNGLGLLYRLLTMCPKQRITAEEAKYHQFFSETPYPLKPSEFPKYPAKSELASTPATKEKTK